MSTEPDSGEWRFSPFAPNASELPYRLRDGPAASAWSVGLFVVAIVGAGLAVRAVLAIPGATPAGGGLLLAMILGAAGLTCVGAWRLLQPVLVLYPDRIEKRGLFGWRSLARGDIAGVTRVHTGRYGSYFEIIARPGAGDGAHLDGRLRSDPVLSAWLSGAPDPQTDGPVRDRARILADARYGATTAEREKRLARAKALVIAFSLACVALAVWLGMFARLDGSTLLLAWAAAGAGALLTATSRGLIVWDARARARPTVLAGLAPLLGVILRAMSIHMIRTGPLVYGALALAGLAGMLALLLPSRSGTRLATAAFAATLVGLAAYGLGVALDVGLDAARAQTFVTTVEDLRVHHGRSTSYTLYLSPWGDDRDVSVRVPSSLYYRLSVGSRVCPVRHPGALGLPWFELRLCSDDGG